MKRLSDQECIRRVKLSIDRQEAGDIPLVFGYNIQIIPHARSMDKEIRELAIVKTDRGDFGVTKEGGVIPLTITTHRTH